MIAMGMMLAVAVAAAAPMTAPGRKGALEGTFIDAGQGAPVILIIPGSGPDRPRRQQSSGGQRGAVSAARRSSRGQRRLELRVDKRGMFGSKAAVADPNTVTIADYADDTHNWVAACASAPGSEMRLVLGHSEGALVALAAAQKPQGICGVILVSGAGPQARRCHSRAAQVEPGQCAGARYRICRARCAGARPSGRRDGHAPAPCRSCSRRRCRHF